jgi:hypothetical protein
LIRDDATPIDADLDPRTNYATLDAEMIARCPHWEKNTNGVDVHLPYYETDNAKLWTILFEIFREHASYTYMRPFEEAQDGRGAYLSLQSHHLGKSNIAALESEAERELERLRYHGETRAINFEKYVNAHIQCHNTLTECMKYGHHGLSEQSKINKFLDGIKTHLMDTPKTSILNDREREVTTDFETVVLHISTTYVRTNLALQHSLRPDDREAATGNSSKKTSDVSTDSTEDQLND